MGPLFSTIGPIARAMSQGYTPLAIVQFLSQVAPRFGKMAKEAEKSGYSSEQVLDVLKNSSVWKGSSEVISEKRKQEKKEAKSHIKTGLAVGGTLLAALSVAPRLWRVGSDLPIGSSPTTGEGPSIGQKLSEISTQPTAQKLLTGPTPATPPPIEPTPSTSPTPSPINMEVGKAAYDAIANSPLGDTFSNLAGKQSTEKIAGYLGRLLPSHLVVAPMEESLGMPFEDIVKHAHAYHQSMQQDPALQQPTPAVPVSPQQASQPVSPVTGQAPINTPPIAATPLPISPIVPTKSKAAFQPVNPPSDVQKTPVLDTREAPHVQETPKTDTREAGVKPTVGDKIITPDGTSGTIKKELAGGSLHIDSDGKHKKVSGEDVVPLTPDIERDALNILRHFPKEELSNVSQHITHFKIPMPDGSVVSAHAQVYVNGDEYIYLNVPEETSKDIANKKYLATTQRSGEYRDHFIGTPSRGAGINQILKNKEKYPGIICIKGTTLHNQFKVIDTALKSAHKKKVKK